jgi:hypothetical protein
VEAPLHLRRPQLSSTRQLNHPSRRLCPHYLLPPRLVRWRQFHPLLQNLKCYRHRHPAPVRWFGSQDIGRTQAAPSATPGAGSPGNTSPRRLGRQHGFRASGSSPPTATGSGYRAIGPNAASGLTLHLDKLRAACHQIERDRQPVDPLPGQIRIEASTLGLDIRFVVSNITTGSAEWLYDTLYCERGQAENLIKHHKSQLASDRTSCRAPLANQMRLILHTAAYWLLLNVRDGIPKAHALTTAEFTTIRLRLMKVAARVIETASRVRVAFAAACSEAALFRDLAYSLVPAAP